MKVLVIGSGGREHAIAWKLAQSKKVTKLFCVPGNGGIEEICECVNIPADDIPELLNFALQKEIDFTVVGPEAPLVNGIVNYFRRKKLKIFGPTKIAAQLEGSKVFAKQFMSHNKIPTAKFKIFSEAGAAKKYIKSQEFPLVVKADGLAGGKGVIICENLEEAEATIDSIMIKKVFGSAGNKIIIEECLMGEEASVLAICDGDNFVCLASAQDHKRIFDNDEGPNTGGMGAYSPAPVVTAELQNRVQREVFAPVLSGMKKIGHKFKGVLYAGLMITEDGPKVLEFNVRFGDPETQAILPRLKDDLAGLMFDAVEGNLFGTRLSWDERSCVCVVCSSAGYPGEYEKGREILGLDELTDFKDVMVFHAGTKQYVGKYFTNGGRVLGVAALGNDIRRAINKTYLAVEEINFEGMHYRKDIGFKAVGNE